VTAADEALARIDADELAELAVELGNVYSPAGREQPAAAYVYDWLEGHGFAPRKIGMFDDRTNVVGKLEGSGGGISLAFNAHLDTLVDRDDPWVFADSSADVLTRAWRDGEGRVWGMPVVKCKGPMACWMIACKALKEAGAELRGDVLLTHVCGQLELEPVDELQGPSHHSHDLGTRYAIAHGAVADFALVAETTNFEAGLIEAGKAWYKITLTAGPSTYTPFMPARASPAASRNAIVHMARFVEAFEDWAADYTRRHTVEYEEGTMVPQAVVTSVRAGSPHKLGRSPERCSAYVDVRLNLETSPLAVRDELRALADSLGVHAEVEQYSYRRGARARGFGPLYDALAGAHEAELGRPLTKQTESPTISMWRDTTPFNEAGIPAIAYGPGDNAATRKGYLTTQEMVAAARIFARVALALCSRARNGIAR
jgi:acetylornithine deacetylase/succinyl-diaminopimelate desuccinylase-like protein